MKDKEIKFLSVEQFARLCGVNPQQVMVWIKNKEINAIKTLGNKDYKIGIENLRIVKNQKCVKMFHPFETQAKVLIVDDELDVIQTITPVFSNHGFTVLSTTDVNEAMFLLHEELPLILTLDIGLCDQNGVEVLRMINELGIKQKIWVIIISAASEADLRSAVDFGADFYLQKPYYESDLNKIIKKLSNNIKKKAA